METLGPVMESHERFPERANIGFMQVVGRSHIRLRVYERGAGNPSLRQRRLRRGGGEDPAGAAGGNGTRGITRRSS